MMPRPRIWPFALVALLPIAPTFAFEDDVPAAVPRGADAPSRQLSTLERNVLRALAMNPATAPYLIETSLKDGRLILSGRVGTKRAHDVAIRTAMAFTPSIDDQLVIDTAETLRAVRPYPGAGGPYAPGPGPTASAYSRVPYVYPQPLFGYWDEPFYGFEPPVISYPPWWGAMSAHRLGESAPRGPLPMGQPGPGPVPGPGAEPETTAGSPLPADTIEMTLDPRGVAVLRGTVPTLEDRIAIGKKIAETPGVSEVVNLLNVAKPESEPEPEAGAEPEQPPPPPVPAEPPAPAAPGPPDAPDTSLDPSRPRAGSDAAATSLAGRVEQAIDRRPALDSTAIQVRERDGVVTLTGQVPSVYEAMLAFRAAQRTPGVREIVDRLAFAVPMDGRDNPLLNKGRPEDIEPYLTAQIQRQVGDSAHIDRVRLHGDLLEVDGILANEPARERVEAILRSLPTLRGFRIEPDLRVDSGT